MTSAGAGSGGYSVAADGTSCCSSGSLRSVANKESSAHVSSATTGSEVSTSSSTSATSRASVVDLWLVLGAIDDNVDVAGRFVFNLG